MAQINNPEDKFSKKLIASINKAGNDWIPIHIVLNDQLDFTLWNARQESIKSTFQQRAIQLQSDLKYRSKSSQQALIQFLSNQENVKFHTIKSHWIANAISCTVHKSFILSVASRPDVKWVGENVSLSATQTQEALKTEQVAPNKAENGLIAIGAREMWALGYTGYGRLVFVADTGTDPEHPAIAGQYNGLLNGDDASWFSFANETRPKDCNKHGTHVTGTILGLDRMNSDTIGVAFNARWMAAGILCGVGTEDNIAAFEWALDPDQNPDTVDDIPDVINNSWYDPSLEGLDCYSIYVPVLEALEAAGVAVVFSAGNEGPNPNTITPPHNINVNEVNSFTVGALNGNTPSWPIASFSSVGPSHCDGSGSLKIKPEVSAPGVSVRSCVPGGGYDVLSGTSMAAPHVSGAILLLKEAFPYLGGKDLKLALYHSATDLGEAGEDNKFGMGIINVYSAYQYLIAKGYQPTPGLIKNDVMLLDVQHAANACNNKINPQLILENAGTDTLRTLDIEFNNNSIYKLVRWEGEIAPGARLALQVTVPEIPSYTGTLQVTLKNPNQTNDIRPLNNTLLFNVTINDRIFPEHNWTYSNNICTNSNFYLHAPVTLPNLPVKVNWYSQAFGGSLLFEGNQILVDAPRTLKGLYAELHYKDITGIKPNLNQSGSYIEGVGEGLIFDANSTFVLDTIMVFSENIGIRNFCLYNENGDSITSSKKYINKIGANIVKLNWTIPAGKNYKIILQSGKALLSELNSGVFPINSVGDIVTIKSGTNGNNYNYFFNWQISYSHPCGRIPYNFNPRQDSVIGKAEFELSQDTLTLPGNTTVQLINKSASGSAYHWDMGDGNSYNSFEVEHAYDETGNFNIILTALDEIQCISTQFKPIVVLEATSVNETDAFLKGVEFIVYPNPVSETLVLNSKNVLNQDVQIHILDLNGTIIGQQNWKAGISEMIIPLDSLTKGVYLLKLNHNTRNMIYKFIKM